ncbi:MAG: DUF4097 domain-containing protein [Lachnospiraceae bacterium]|jgi:hypothetical protein|nr:DUF4097 domain-containing protein [Lachnospiraceae bacterium]
MKKFIKIGLIAGCLFVIAGIGIATAAFALGTSPGRIVWRLEQLSRWERQTERDRYEPAGVIEQPLDEAVPGEQMPGAAVPAAPTLAGAQTEPAVGVGNFESVYSIVSVLEVRQSGGNVELYVVEGQSEMTVRGENADFNHVNYEETDRFQKVKIRAYAGESYRIFIPADWVLDQLDVEITSGNFNGDNIKAREAEYQTESGSGTIVASQSVGDILEIDCKGGSIEWSCTGSMPALVEAECERGVVNLALPGELSPETIGYSLECEYGTIELLDAGRFTGLDEKAFSPQGRTIFLELSAEDNGAIYIVQ